MRIEAVGVSRRVRAGKSRIEHITSVSLEGGHSGCLHGAARSCLEFLLEHDLYREPASTFQDHALATLLPEHTIERLGKVAILAHIEHVVHLERRQQHA
jgi:hypothetical protein